MTHPVTLDERFALDEFLAREPSSEHGESLARELRIAIARELAPGIRELGARIAKRLNTLGHQVHETEFEVDSEDGAVFLTYVDTSAGAGREKHRLRFNLDLVISSGFPGYSEI